MHRSRLMPALDSLLKRFGFVRIARYGLVLTPEGRIMSLRPAVLEDGLGGRIVGWPDGDLAAMELQKWEPARPAPLPAVATRLAVRPPAIPLPKPAPVAAPKPAPIAAPVAAPVVVPAPVLAEPAQVDEDEWEWTIALARARAAAEESEQAAASVRRARLDTIPPPAAQPKLVVVTIPQAAEPIAVAERPLAAPVGVRKPQVTRQLPVATIPPRATPVAATPPRAGTAPPTVIPVPRLPSIKDRQLQIQPVISSAPSRLSRPRLAKGTGPVLPPMIRAGEDDEKTMPGLPPAAAMVALPSIKRLSR